MKKYNFNNGLLLGLAFILLFSCSKKSDIPQREPLDGKMIAVNTISGSEAQDFYQNDTKLTATSIAYGEATELMPVKGGNNYFSFRNKTKPTEKNTETLVTIDGSLATAFLISDGTGSSKALYGYNINIAPAAGKIKIRFINFSTVFNNELSITYTGTTKSVITGNLGITKDMTKPAYIDYLEIDATTGITVAVVGSEGNPKVDIPANQLVAGKIYTIWFDATNNVTPKYHIVKETP